MDYSPFLDNEGNRKTLQTVMIEDILLIEELGLEEGYKVEFKREQNENLKKKH